MKTIIFILLLFATVFFWQCQKDAEIQPKDFPFVVTNEATQIDSTGVTFSAEILDFGKEEIIDFGFIWLGERGEYIHSLKEKGNIKDFNFRLTSDLKDEEVLTYKAFIKTKANTVYANTIDFVSNGSKMPVIKDFYPKEGYDSTKVTIIGYNFSYKPENNYVMINGLEVKLIQSSFDTLAFIIPENNMGGAAEIVVQVGETKVVAKEKFLITGPVITNISANEGYSGDTIKITGSRFIEANKTTELFWGMTKMSIIELSNSEIVAVIPLTEEHFSNIKDYFQVFVGTKKATSTGQYTIVHRWEPEGIFPYLISWDHEVFVYENEGYVIDFTENKIFKHQTANNTWHTVSSQFIPGSKSNSLCIPQNQFIYKAGGFDYPNVTVSREMWKYNLKANQWDRLKDIPFGFIKAVYFFKDGFTHVITDRQEHWKCDFENELYTKLNNVPVKISTSYNMPFMNVFKSKNRTFLIASGKTFEYNFETDSWTFKVNHPYNIWINDDPFRYKCVEYNDKGYILKFSSVRNDLFQYDVKGNIWKLISYTPLIPDSYSVGTSFIVWSTSEKLYITGGNSEGSGFYSSKNF
ncbi:MAG: IPT/TIG domain-containing protein [Prolixibacteraceae bacterium]|nr:IPT/TIG domain-containing protein [Prolixibacteraceae bacterium]